MEIQADRFKNVKVASTAIIYPNVEIGEGSEIGHYCIIGHPATGEAAGKKLKIGKNAIVRSHTIIYEGSEFGDDLRVGHSTMIREGIKAGLNWQIGSFNDIEGDCEVGDYVRFHSNVHIGRGAKIGDLVWIFPYVVLTNDPIPPSGLKEGVSVESGAVICTSSVVLPGAHVGRGTFVAALTKAKGRMEDWHMYVGERCTDVGSVAKLFHKPSGKRHPWMQHFRSYPEPAQKRIDALWADFKKFESANV